MPLLSCLSSLVYPVKIKQGSKQANSKQSIKQSPGHRVQTAAGLKHIYWTLIHPYITNNNPSGLKRKVEQNKLF